MEDVLRQLVSKAQTHGASYAEARFQDLSSSLVSVENGILENYTSQILRGIGIRVLIRGSWGYASSSELSKKSLDDTLRSALKMAKAASKRGQEVEIAQTDPIVDEKKSEYSVDPSDVSPEEVIELASEANKAATTSTLIKNVITRIGALKDTRVFANSEGSLIKVSSLICGIGHVSVAKLNDSMERVYDQESRCSGFEYLRNGNWNQFTREISLLAEKAVRASVPKSGTYEVIADPELIGLILHEGFGHASEADLINTGESILEGKLNSVVAAPEVTVVDEGIVSGGYFVPYDDEGLPKKRTIIVEDGILRGYLHSRHTAMKLGAQPTGNCRAMDFESEPIVRQTNYHLEPRDHSFQELIEGIQNGYYVLGRGAGGGQVDVGGGTFTFSVGPSFVVENGELKEMVRGTTVSGSILETLKTIDAVGSDPKITTSIFGGCGKGGQMAKVGDGGPHVRIRSVTIGGPA